MKRIPFTAFAATLVALPLGYLTAGVLGAVFAGVTIWIAFLLLVGSRVEPGAGPAPRRRKGVPLADAEYPSYRRLLSLIGWAQRSPRHYDYAVRPTFQGLAAARLAQRRGVDLYTQQLAAAELLGGDWPLVDPARPADQRSAPPGLSLERIDGLVRRLEEL